MDFDGEKNSMVSKLPADCLKVECFIVSYRQYKYPLLIGFDRLKFKFSFGANLIKFY